MFLRASGLNLPISRLILFADSKPTRNTPFISIARPRTSPATAATNSAALPADLDYGRLSGLSNEIKQKFIAVRPVSLGQARRIEGVTPAALALIAAHARRAERSSGRDRLPAGT